MSLRDDGHLGSSPPGYDGQAAGVPPTFAAFSPVTLSANTPSRSSRRSTILVHQKSPLLLATPPQITRALAYSHPFILPLNSFAGLLTWSSGDSWQSFLLLCTFWAIVLYGDLVLRWAGPVVVGVGLIAGMYGRRYSPLSSSGWTEPARDPNNATLKPAASANATGASNQTKAAKAGAAEKQTKHTRDNSEVTNTKHQKTLDEIVETLKELTGRCNVLLEPLLEMTDFLSTQRTPTSATTKPALTAMFMRLIIVTPFWAALTAPPWRIVTTRRVVLLAGTLVLTYHSRVMRVSRAIIWRSATVRRLASAITGLHFENPSKALPPKLEPGNVKATGQGASESELTKAFRKPSLQINHRRSGSSKSAGVKFTFILYENQRRWVGLGWTNNLFAYERPAWTDEQHNAVPPKDEFELPDVEDGHMQWRWAGNSSWRVDGVPDEYGPVDYDGEEGKNGWVYYDNKWQNGRRGQDGWGRWTRRRKWYRDAELVEVEPSTAHELDAGTHKRTPSTNDLHHHKYSTTNEKMISPMRSEPALPLLDQTPVETHPSRVEDIKPGDDSASLHSTSSKSWIFRPPPLRRRGTGASSADKDQQQQQQGQPKKQQQRTRSTSDVLSEEEDVSGLGIEVEMELQHQGKDGGQWGIGDEARMNLE